MGAIHERALQRFSQHSGLDTTGVQRITPPWTYQLLAASSALMLAAELLVGIVQISKGH